MIKLITLLLFLVFPSLNALAGYISVPEAKLKTLEKDDAIFALTMGYVNSLFKKHCEIPLRDIISVAYKTVQGQRYSIVFDTKYGPLNVLAYTIYWQKSVEVQQIKFLEPQIPNASSNNSKITNTSKSNQTQTIANSNVSKVISSNSSNSTNSTKDIKIQQKINTTNATQFEFPELKQKCDLMKKQIQKLAGDTIETSPPAAQQMMLLAQAPVQSSSATNFADASIASRSAINPLISLLESNKAQPQSAITATAPVTATTATVNDNKIPNNISNVNANNTKVTNSTNSTKPVVPSIATVMVNGSSSNKNTTQPNTQNVDANGSQIISATNKTKAPTQSTPVPSSLSQKTVLADANNTLQNTNTVTSPTAKPIVSLNDGPVVPTSIKQAAALQQVNKNIAQTSTNSSALNKSNDANLLASITNLIIANSLNMSGNSNITTLVTPPNATSTAKPSNTISPQSNKTFPSAAAINISSPIISTTPIIITTSTASTSKPASTSTRMLRQTQP